ncbi:MAG: MFS transporter [Clostridium sp.]|uniref:MFS transporter n=1 Tax=Clostridium sp. TaxID=1506 RepID=UPI002907566C|nr:MFS transporter [Clostridium sp.]MDU7336684.1 MFS transporter [Clostridium sp.]
MQEKPNRYIYLLSAGHLFTDMNQGALPIILPFLITAYHFTYAEVASLVLASTVVSSIIQPVFGSMADKTPRPWMMAVGVLLAGGGMAAVGFLSDYRLLFLSIMISGIGVAAFHPEGARMANKVSGEKKGAGVSIFSFGGNAGFAVGPILAATSIAMFGLKGTAILAIPCVLMAITFFTQIRKMNAVSAPTATAVHSTESSPEPDQWKPFSLLSILLFGRSIVFCGLSTFLPLFFIQILQQSDTVGSALLSFYFVIGAASTLIGGRLGDRYGFIKITRIGFTLLVPIMAALAITRSLVPTVLLLIPLAFALYSPSSLTVVLGQKYLPNRMGLASGITLGLSVSIGGMVAPLLGRLADSHGLLAAMYALAAISAIPAIMSFTLKDEKKQKPELPIEEV